jgi:hypothetical protein
LQKILRAFAALPSKKAHTSLDLPGKQGQHVHNAATDMVTHCCLNDARTRAGAPRLRRFHLATLIAKAPASKLCRLISWASFVQYQRRSLLLKHNEANQIWKAGIASSNSCHGKIDSPGQNPAQRLFQHVWRTINKISDGPPDK